MRGNQTVTNVVWRSNSVDRQATGPIRTPQVIGFKGFVLAATECVADVSEEHSAFKVGVRKECI
jgi:hypothetical protein